MTSLRLCFFFLLLQLPWNFLQANELAQEEKVVVHLPTQSDLLPAYVINSSSQAKAGFRPEYIEKLMDVFRFDLNYNGKTTVVEALNNKEDFVKDDFEAPFNLAFWRSSGSSFCIKFQVHEKQVGVRAFHIAKNSVKLVRNIPLTGELDVDRGRIHQLSDILFKSFFSSDGIASTQILYSKRLRNHSSDSTKWTSEIWQCDYDGANAKQITSDGSYAITPNYVPPKPGLASGSFFYVSYQKGQPKIYTASLRDGKANRFSFLRGNQLMPAISKQRDKVAFINDVTGNPDLFLQDFSTEVGLIGKPRQIFSAPYGTQASPSFSPDGQKLAFVSNKDGSPRIYILNIPPSGARIQNVQASLISKRNRESTSPSWSPDGSKLAYSSLTEGERQIWIYDFLSQREWQLTNGAGHKENPSWAPDSLHLSFNLSTPFSSELYFVNLNQKEAIKITDGPGEKRFPAWETR